MTVRRDVVRFLRDVPGFVSDVDPTATARHAAALNDIVGPAIALAADHPLRAAQERAWTGLSKVRTGLLLGPPGTGKTHLLSWLVLGHMWAQQTAGRPSRAFITAFTRSAIETSLAAIAPRAEHGPSRPHIVYLTQGRPDTLPEGIDCVNLRAKGSVADLRAHLSRPCVILAGTVWGLYAALEEGCFPEGPSRTSPHFDLVGIDEASQMVLGQGLMALAAMAPRCRVIVAGDDRQLPPVRSARGMVIDGREIGGSLYAFLKASNAPEYALDETFRLNRPLTVYPERRFYAGGYRSAVPDRTIQLAEDWSRGLQDWERVVLDPRFPTVILVHDGPSAATESPFEVGVGARLADLFGMLLRDPSGLPYRPAAFWSEAFALVSPHRAQNAALRRRLGSSAVEPFVETVDKIQGRERDVVVLTYAVSDPEFALAEADFIFSPERLNVAITRARSKLVVVVARKLLDLLPPRQETLDKSEVLREFAFACPTLGETNLEIGGLAPVKVTVRAGGFGSADGEQPEWDQNPVPASQEEQADSHAIALLDAIREHAAISKHGSVMLSQLQKAVPHPGGVDGLFVAVRDLHAAGWASLWLVSHGKYGPFWTARPLEARRRVVGPDDSDVHERVLAAVVGGRTRYEDIRDRFLWMGPARSDVDLLRPVIDGLVNEGVVEWVRPPGGGAFLSRVGAKGETEVMPSAPVPSDDDFRVLNALENLEARRIESGLVEVWSEAGDVVRSTKRPLVEVSASLGRLSIDGHVLLAADGRVRSRMAELAREVRYVKQRFKQGDSSERPFLVRALKVRTRDRVKPIVDVPLSEVLNAAGASHADPEVDRALSGLQAALAAVWGQVPALAGFQARGFTQILSSWLGASPTDSFVIAADTGSGKTETAVLPMIAGACIDALRGIGGTRAVLAYPRVRLVANQAQRLARYLAALADAPGMPTLTVGVQFADVPSSFDMAAPEHTKSNNAGWVREGEGWRFPLFGCPVPSCGGPLVLHPKAGVGSNDRLSCGRCGWAFGGWAGTKRTIRTQPPTFFLPTMDSLHQWMQDPSAARIFGDLSPSSPRALLADEIHLYAYVHGAQVGYAMRRFLERSRGKGPERQSCLAIGMSATLGDPARAFARLVGRQGVRTVRPDSGETPVNPRGREYFYFIQPEVESRERDVAGASTAIQSLMCLAHGMRRRRGVGGFRSLAFVDSIDKVRRLHSAYYDAEEDKGLAALRTVAYDDDPLTGRPRNSCCGEPATCGRFAEGECWYFAATDRRQATADGTAWSPGRPLAVARAPVFSGTEGTIEAMVRSSDVVFATSSLEVGYDDPDINLVFQHYGPQNLASFVQRKGRGGRGADDRPITAVTLSLYAPRDTEWFHRPDTMLNAQGFEAPLNPDNHFVRRAQLASHLLDGMASFEAITGKVPWLGRGILLPEALVAAAPALEAVFGEKPWTAFGFASLQAFWESACRDAAPTLRLSSAREAREAIPWLPRFLHDDAGLPKLDVLLPEELGAAPHDMGLAFALLAPGNIARRFHARVAAWRPPRSGVAPWFADADYAAAIRFQPCGPSAQDLVAELPPAARAALGPNVGPDVVLPVSVTLEEAGMFARSGAGWDTNLFAGSKGVAVANTPAERAAAIRHDCAGYLESCLIVKADDVLCARVRSPLPATDIDCIRVFAGDRSQSGGSGLLVTTVAWGSEAVLPSQMPGVDPATFSQTFADASTGRPALHGYQVETEGIQVVFNSERISAFIDREIANPLDGALRWQRLHMARSEAATRLRAAGVGRFDAERLGILLGYLATSDTHADALARMRRFWRTQAFVGTETSVGLLEQIRADRLSCDPLLTARRVARAAACLHAPAAATAVREALVALDDDAARQRFLRSTLLNGLALRWRQLFVQVAQGDERRVTVHTKLPFHYLSSSSDVVTLAEVGQSGDGTTRSFFERLPQAWEKWSTGFAVACPNAGEDAALDRFFALPQRHAAWLALHPRDDVGVANMAAELGTGASLPPSVSRTLFGSVGVGSDIFRIYDLVAEIRDARQALEVSLQRAAIDWELPSAVTAAIESGEGSPELTRLFSAYAADPVLDGEGSLSARSRFAEQVQRIGSRLCTDGCRACVRQDGGTLFGLVASSMVSRELVSRYLCA